MNYNKIILNKVVIKLIPLGDCACGCGMKTNIAKQSEKKRGWVKGQPKKYISGHNPKGGWKWSDESKAKASLAQKGNSHSKGRMLSEEHKRKIGEGNKKAHPATLFNYKCKSCGNEFMARQKNREYCSIGCKVAHKEYDHTCSKCGNLFKSKAPNSEWCPECLMAICETCGKEFKLIAAGETRKYCSPGCFHKSEVGREAPNKKPFYTLTCPICEIEFEVPERRKDKAKYCSPKCLGEAKSRITGDEHPLWKGGFDLYGRMLSQNEGSFYRNRKVVLERDGYACRHCGFKGDSKIMDVHHITPVRLGGTSMEDNMITLCRKHHNWADHGKISAQLLRSYIEPVQQAVNQ
jgi:5-methylcytosine-specific restriction endonuclease McrA